MTNLYNVPNKNVFRLRFDTLKRRFNDVPEKLFDVLVAHYPEPIIEPQGLLVWFSLVAVQLSDESHSETAAKMYMRHKPIVEILFHDASKEWAQEANELFTKLLG